MSKPDGGPAFPQITTPGASARHEYTGLTLRDYFAAASLIGMPLGPNTPNSPEQAAEWAYIQADAMIAERDK